MTEQYLRYTRGGGGSHWEGCDEAHWDCKIAKLEKELVRRDETIARLKEAGDNLIQLANFKNKKAIEYIDAWSELTKELE